MTRNPSSRSFHRLARHGKELLDPLAKYPFIRTPTLYSTLARCVCRICIRRSRAPLSREWGSNAKWASHQGWLSSNSVESHTSVRFQYLDDIHSPAWYVRFSIQSCAIEIDALVAGGPVAGSCVMPGIFILWELFGFLFYFYFIFCNFLGLYFWF